MDEKTLERKLKERVKKLGGLCWKFTSPGTAGVPDRIVVLPDGQIIFVELKGDLGRLSFIQKVRLAELTECHAKAIVCKGSLEAFEDAIHTP